MTFMDLDSIKDLRNNYDKNYPIEMDHNDPKENLIYGQQLLKTGGWKYDLIKSKDIFVIISHDRFIKYINEAVFKILGYDPAEVIGKKIDELFNADELQRITDMFFLIVNGNKNMVQGNIAAVTKNGKTVYFEAIIQNLLQDPSIEGFVINLRDITRRIELKKNMAHISYHDELTSLPNAISFKNCLKVLYNYSRAYEKQFALMMLDVAGMKYINYSLGHDIGDKLIVEIVQRLRKFLKRDAFICRYSDNNFGIIVFGLKALEEYEIIAKEIIDLFIEPYIIEDYQLDISANLGVCMYTDDIKDYISIKKHAQVALLRANRNGKNSYQFHSSNLDIQNYKETTLRNDLHYAIEREELKVYYQPIVNLNTYELLAAEALIRWEHSEWGMVMPDELIPIAEETGLIIDIGKWVLAETCKNYRRWIDNKFPPIKIAVNFSGIQFLESNFVRNIKSTIDKYNLEYDFLIVEITENIFFQKTDKITSDIKYLQSLGIEVSLDDFGKGFSSLSMLSDFNMDILKIDDSFIKALPSNRTNTSITTFTINLAKELKMKLVAEGIENRQQLTYLKSLNYHVGQGYIFSKPLPLSDFEEILVKKRCYPTIVGGSSVPVHQERRMLFRIEFYQLLESKLTILEINQKKLNVGNTRVLIRDIGPGGLCFISNIMFPIEKGVVLQFNTRVLHKEINIVGYPVWISALGNNLYMHGVELIINEKERDRLIQILNQVQIKMKNNYLFAEGSFISGSYLQYFNKASNDN